jgi:ABC-type antimicrobial peptide transport system permease subunit
MHYSTCFRIAIKALGRHKLRTFLTMLGMIIGVGAVMTMVALGNGAQASVESDVKSAGTNLVYVTAGNYTRGGDDLNVAAGLGAAKTLTKEDAEEIGRRVSSIKYWAPGVSDRAPMETPGRRYFGRVIGTVPAFALMHSWRYRTGTMFTESQLASGAAVAVLGTIASEQLFGPGVDPVGRTFTIRGKTYSVTGVTESRIEDHAECIFTPYTAVQQAVGGITHLQTITVAAEQAGDTARIAEEINRLLRVRHHIGKGDGSETVGVPDDFMVRTEAAKALSQGLYTSAAVFVLANLPQLDQITAEEMSGTLQQTSNTLTALLASIAIISLVVGGIGIMNIMLVSVTERTREIGVRMAIGARSRDVLRQFLIEAFTLSMVGGLLGVGFGFAASSALTRLLEWQTTMSAGAVLLAFGTALAIGVFFGFYPARKASQLDPIDALRFE